MCQPCDWRRSSGAPAEHARQLQVDVAVLGTPRQVVVGAPAAGVAGACVQQVVLVAVSASSRPADRRLPAWLGRSCGTRLATWSRRSLGPALCYAPRLRCRCSTAARISSPFLAVPLVVFRQPGQAGVAACGNDPHRETFRAVLLAKNFVVRATDRNSVHARAQGAFWLPSPLSTAPPRAESARQAHPQRHRVQSGAASYQPSVARPMSPLLASPCIGISRRYASTPSSKFTSPWSSTPRP